MNYYERPVAQNFIDTYAPLPFQEMAMLGNVYKKEKDTTEAAIDEFKAKYGDFTSMSQADANAWDAETIGKINPKLLEMASDPEKIKSQEFQAGIRSAIRSVDTSKLSALRQSAENLKQRAQMIAKLQVNGKYKQSWDPVNLASWDTTKQGIMTDLSPIEYQSLHDIASPYTQGLHDQYLGKIDKYRYWKGVDEKQIRNALNTVSSDIFSTPQGANWYKDIATEMAQKGITDPKVVREEMMNRLVQSQKDYMRKNLAFDTSAIQEDTLNLKRSIAKGKTEAASSAPARYTDMIRLDGKRYIQNLSAGGKLNNDNIKRAAMNLHIATISGNKEKISSAQKEYDSAKAQAVHNDVSSTIRNNFEFAIGRPLTKSVNYTELVKGSRSVIDLLSTDNDLDGAKLILKNSSNAVQKKDSSEQFIMKDSRYLQNPTTVVSSLDGIKLRKHSNEFDKLLTNGAFKNLTIEPVTTKGLFNYTDKNGNFKQKQKVIVTVKEGDIDLSSIRNSAYAKDRSKLLDLFHANGASIARPGTDESNSSVTYDIDSDGVRTPKKGNISGKTKDANRYITFEAFVDVPSDENETQGTVVSSINADYNKLHLTDKAASSLYPQEQQDAFYSDDVDLDNILNE